MVLKIVHVQVFVCSHSTDSTLLATPRPNLASTPANQPHPLAKEAWVQSGSHSTKPTQKPSNKKNGEYRMLVIIKLISASIVCGLKLPVTLKLSFIFYWNTIQCVSKHTSPSSTQRIYSYAWIYVTCHRMLYSNLLMQLNMVIPQRLNYWGTYCMCFKALTVV